MPIEIISDGTVAGTTITRTGIATGTVSVAPDFISYNGAIGLNWTVNVTTAQSNLPGGTAMDLNSVDDAVGAGLLNIYWEADGFTKGAPFTGTDGGTLSAGFTDTYDACIDDGDGLSLPFCGAAFTTPRIGSETFTTSPFSGGFSSGLLATSNPFGLEQHLQISTTAAGVISQDAALLPAPEPTSVLLLGGAFVLACGASIRRKDSPGP